MRPRGRREAQFLGARCEWGAMYMSRSACNWMWCFSRSYSRQGARQDVGELSTLERRRRHLVAQWQIATRAVKAPLLFESAIGSVDDGEEQRKVRTIGCSREFAGDSPAAPTHLLNITCFPCLALNLNVVFLCPFGESRHLNTLAPSSGLFGRSSRLESQTRAKSPQRQKKMRSDDEEEAEVPSAVEGPAAAPSEEEITERETIFGMLAGRRGAD